MKQTRQDQTTTTNVTLTDRIHLKLTAIILEAHIACLNQPDNFPKTLSDQLKQNYDIDATFPNRDSQKIFNMYYNVNNRMPLDNQEEDLPQTLPDIEMIEATDKRRRTSSHDDETPAPATKTHRTQEHSPAPTTSRARQLPTRTEPPQLTPNRFERLDWDQMDPPETSDATTTWQAVKPKRKTSKRQTPQKKTPPFRKPRTPPSQAPSHEGLPRLDSNWRPETLDANLPKPQRPTSKTPTVILPEDLGLKLMKNERDKTSLPTKIDKTYLTQQLTTLDNSTGLKLYFHKDEDPDMILSLLTEGLIPITYKNIFSVPPDKFELLPRISRKK